jgi:hypothetical protein
MPSTQAVTQFLVSSTPEGLRLLAEGAGHTFKSGKFSITRLPQGLNLTLQGRCHIRALELVRMGVARLPPRQRHPQRDGHPDCRRRCFGRDFCSRFEPGAKRAGHTKVYSLHAPEVECIGKGKAHKPYEVNRAPLFVWDRLCAPRHSPLISINIIVMVGPRWRIQMLRPRPRPSDQIRRRKNARQESNLTARGQRAFRTGDALLRTKGLKPSSIAATLRQDYRGFERWSKRSVQPGRRSQKHRYDRECRIATLAENS